MATLAEHQEQLLNLQSRSLRLAYALQNFSDIRKAQNVAAGKSQRGGGRTWPALKYIKDADVEGLAIELCRENWAGKKCAAQMMLMAEKALGWLRITDADFRQRWGLGRLLMSAFTYAGIYHLGQIDDHPRAPYYVLDAYQSDPENELPERTAFEPFPKWTKNIDKFGNTLVRGSYPCPPKYRFTPNISSKTQWVKAVHRLESVGFQINKEVLAFASDPKVNEKLVPSKIDAKTKKGLKECEALRPRIKTLQAKYDSDSPKDPTHKFTKKEKEFWSGYWTKYRPLKATENRILTRRRQFENELRQAMYLSLMDKPFYHRVSVDYRGRVYLPTFSYQGSDFCRAVIEFADSGLMTNRAIGALARHTMNVWGLYKVPDVDQRIDIGLDQSSLFANTGRNPFDSDNLNGLCRADKPFCLYRSCLEWRNVWAHLGVGLKTSRKAVDKKRLASMKMSEAEQKWFENHYKTLDLVTVKKKTHKGSGFPIAKDNKQLRTHLPIAADHKSSAFIHIGSMVRGNAGRAMQDKALDEDLYQHIADRCTNLPKDKSRAIVKLICVPWSYGGTDYSIKDKVSEWRLENAGKIKFLDQMSWQDLSQMVDDVLDVLNREFEASGIFRGAISRAIARAQQRTDKRPTDGIEWTTASGFVVHQAVFRTTRKVDLVANGFDDDVQIVAKMPTEVVDWKKMETKAPPNLVHSQDATVVHWMLAGDMKYTFEIAEVAAKRRTNWDFHPMVTVHDSFSVLPDDAWEVAEVLEVVTALTYNNDPFVQFGQSVIGEHIDVRQDNAFRLGADSYS